MKAYLKEKSFQEERILKMLETRLKNEENLARSLDTKKFVDDLFGKNRKQEQNTISTLKYVDQIIKNYILGRNLLFKEARILQKFFEQIFVKDKELVTFESIADHFEKLKNQILTESELWRTFSNEFLEMKCKIESKEFSFFEMANYLHEQKLKREQLEIIAKFLNKAKRFFNSLNGKPKNYEIHPKNAIPNEFLRLVLQIKCNRDLFFMEIVNEVMSQIFKKSQENPIYSRILKEEIIRMAEHNMIPSLLILYYEELNRSFRELQRILEKIVEIAGDERESTDKLLFRLIHLLENKTIEMQEDKSLSEIQKLLGIKKDKTEDELIKFFQGKDSQRSDRQKDETEGLKSTKNIDFLSTGREKVRFDDEKEFDRFMSDYGLKKSTISSSQHQEEEEKPFQLIQCPNEEYFASLNIKFDLKSLSPSFVMKILDMASQKNKNSQFQDIKSDKLSSFFMKLQRKFCYLDEADLNKDMAFYLKHSKIKDISTFMKAINDSYYYPEGNNLGPIITLRNDGAIDYQYILPKDYYKHQLMAEAESSKVKTWFIRPHHIESLTGFFIIQKIR